MAKNELKFLIDYKRELITNQRLISMIHICTFELLWCNNVVPCMYVCMYVCMYICIYVYVCVCMYVSSYICMYVFMIAHARRILTNAVDPDLITQHLLFGRDIQHLDSNYQFTAL